MAYRKEGLGVRGRVSRWLFDPRHEEWTHAEESYVIDHAEPGSAI